MKTDLADGYSSNTQKARIITENWLSENMFCPRCGRSSISHFENNRPVADFYCPDCGNQFELKSRRNRIASKVSDGAYDMMVQRITGLNNPDFFFMSYSAADWTINDLLFVPKHFFTPSVIEKRNPLSPNARRAGWTGCNILVNLIPETGKISIISHKHVLCKEDILQKVSAVSLLAVDDINSRGWIFDVLRCIEELNTQEFSLSEIYAFENMLHEKHPSNNNIRPKIRQQLQLLRDKGIIEFTGSGKYRRLI